MNKSESVDRLEPMPETQGRHSIAVGHTGLEAVGFIFAGVTAMVIAIAVLVTQRHVAGKDTVEQSVLAVPAAASAGR